MSSRDGGEHLAQVARDLQAQPAEADQLQLAVDTAVKIVCGCDHAGISLITSRGIAVGASSDETALRGDLLQYELSEGPCLDSVRDHQTVISRNLSGDPRWPRWSEVARSDLGVHAMMSLLLYTNARSYGALNLYADQVDGYDAEDHAVAQALAAQIAVSLAARREIDQRGIAMANRTVIGQAEGVVMERLSVDADQAFAYLRRVSQHTNRKLLAVCAELVQTRRLPPARVPLRAEAQGRRRPPGRQTRSHRNP